MWHNLIESNEIPELPTVARSLFLDFYNIAEGQISHPNDLHRYNVFIKHCHARRVRLTYSQLRFILLKIRCPEERVEKLIDIYYYGRKLLQYPRK